jgi:hypothetical protein
VLIGTQTSRFHIVSVPVDVGIRCPMRPQDMAVEHWLSIDQYGTQHVVNLDLDFHPLLEAEDDDGILYMLVKEPQVCYQRS